MIKGLNFRGQEKYKGVYIDEKEPDSFCLLLLLLAASTAIYALTAEEIIEKRDNNEYIETARAEMEMIIRSGRREMIKTMVSLTDRENSLTEFTNPRDRGTKFLKRGDELW
ncbi:MAG: hypothetical protein GX175_06350, partial [Halanaerobiaceae bacterium]|nr:hypothetical protein [Halanaerobiaceae bacterium]